MVHARGTSMNTTEVLRKVTIPRQKLYYLEQKGFIQPRKRRVGEKEFREYTKWDLEKIRLIWQFVQEGFRYRVAHEKAMEALNSQNKS